MVSPSASIVHPQENDHQVLPRMLAASYVPSRRLPSHVIGIVSLVVLAVAILARYVRHLTGAWRWIYAVNVVVGLYTNCSVLVANASQKLPAPKATAPIQSEAPFV